MFLETDKRPAGEPPREAFGWPLCEGDWRSGDDGFAESRPVVADDDGEGRPNAERRTGPPESPRRKIVGADAIGRWACEWLAEPDVGRVANGIPSRMDRLRALGNAVVPQIPEIIGRAILEAEGLA